MNPTVLATVNQKGGVAKTTSCINIGAAMAREGKKVLLVDTDPQASMTISLGNQQPDQLAPTIADLMTKVMNDVPIAPGEGILHHPEGIDLLPANIALAGTEVSLVNAMSRETILKQVLATVNQKGGVAKTTSCINIGAAMAREGKKVLLVDTDPQASMTISLGNQQPDQLAPTIADLMTKVMNDVPIAPGEGILHHPEGIDLLPANIALAGTEVSLVNAMSRETILKQVLARNRQDYDCIIIDCMPSLGMLTINALAAADRVIIPVQAHYLSAKGLEQLLQTIAKVRRQMNPKLKIDGILMTMVDGRTNNAKEITTLIRETYGSKIKVFETAIPNSVRAAEASLTGKSIFEYDPGGKVAQAYRALTKEVLQLEKQRQKAKSDLLR